MLMLALNLNEITIISGSMLDLWISLIRTRFKFGKRAGEKLLLWFRVKFRRSTRFKLGFYAFDLG